MAALLDDATDAETSELLADKAYDSDSVRLLLASRDIVATIPSRSNRRASLYYDSESYKARHLVENAFADAKQFRGMATRYCKLVEMFAGMVSLVAWYVGTRSGRRGASRYRRQAGVSGVGAGQLPLASPE